MRNIIFNISIIFTVLFVCLGCKKKCPEEVLINNLNESINTWISRESGISDNLLSIDFIDNNIGYVCGVGGKIFKTTNGGITFNQQNSGSIENLYSMDFIDKNNGFAVGDNNTLLKTNDGGINWSKITLPFSSNFRHIHFENVFIGYLSGGGSIFKTSDGGTTWLNYNFGGNENIYDISFFDNKSGLICGYNILNNVAVIKKTNDGGISWKNQKIIDSQSAILNSIAMVNKSTAYLIANKFGSNSSKFYKTINGGTNWFEIYSNPNNSFLKLSFVDSNIGYAVGGNFPNNTGLILKTIDGGNTWNNLSKNPKFVYSIKIINNISGFTCGFNGLFMNGTK